MNSADPPERARKSAGPLGRERGASNHYLNNCPGANRGAFESDSRLCATVEPDVEREAQEVIDDFPEMKRLALIALAKLHVGSLRSLAREHGVDNRTLSKAVLKLAQSCGVKRNELSPAHRSRLSAAIRQHWATKRRTAA